MNVTSPADSKLGAMRFAKGHGTENDFVILPDPDGLLDLSPRLVTRLCDRRAGLGADGVLRVVRTAALADPAVAGAAVEAPVAAKADSGWFMDYRNADGSIAEMCGNGLRVFARYLLDNDLVSRELVYGEPFTIGTRSGSRTVRVEPGGDITAEMGAVRIQGPGRASVGGRVCEGLRVSVGNPHLACLVDGSLDEFDLSVPPELDHGQFPEGANVELIRVTGRAAVQIRVRERGSGETRSCGTGAVAAAVAAAHAPARSELQAVRGEADSARAWRVRVPGGELAVIFDGTNSWLTGPAVIVATGEVSGSWLSLAAEVS